MSSILTVDDEPGIRAFLVDSLTDVGHDVAQAADGDAALQALEDRPFDLMLLDLRMPGSTDGMGVLRQARARFPAMQIIVLTAFGTISEAVEAMRLGAFDFLQKPLESPDAVRRLVSRALAWKGRPARPARPVEEEDRGGVRPATRPSALRALLGELRRRHVYHAVATYAAVALASLQVGQLILPVLPLPGGSYAWMVGAALLGLPVVLMLGWIYDISLTRTRRPAGSPDR